MTARECAAQGENSEEVEETQRVKQQQRQTCTEGVGGRGRVRREARLGGRPHHHTRRAYCCQQGRHDAIGDGGGVWEAAKLKVVSRHAARQHPRRRRSCPDRSAETAESQQPARGAPQVGYWGSQLRIVRHHLTDKMPASRKLGPLQAARWSAAVPQRHGVRSRHRRQHHLGAARPQTCSSCPPTWPHPPAPLRQRPRHGTERAPPPTRRDPSLARKTLGAQRPLSQLHLIKRHGRREFPRRPLARR